MYVTYVCVMCTYVMDVRMHVCYDTLSCACALCYVWLLCMRVMNVCVVWMCCLYDMYARYVCVYFMFVCACCAVCMCVCYVCMLRNARMYVCMYVCMCCAL